VPDLLYLDTARLGRMTPAARRAEHALVALAGTEGTSAYFDRLLRHGLKGSPFAAQRRYEGLGHWAGVGELKQSLRTLAGHRPDLPVLVAHRSAQLMKLAARALFYSCRNVLTVDLGWPGYQSALQSEAVRVNRCVTAVEMRAEVLSGRYDEAELIERVCLAFAREGCDGLFLPAVSNWGVRLPVDVIVRRLKAIHRVWFVAVDGAQEFCHLPGRLEAEYCDLYLTGCSKWLGAHHPMGVAFYGRRRSRGAIDRVLADMTAVGDLDDPLLRFTTHLEAGTPGGAETLNLTSLFTARAAVADAGPSGGAISRLANAASVAQLAPEVGWSPVQPAVPLRSGILLLQAGRVAVRSLPPDVLRSTLRDAGVAATAYDGGQLRLSMPATALTTGELDGLRHALRRAS
jgi:hypothetical protein